MKKYISLILFLLMLWAFTVPASATVSVQMNTQRYALTDRSSRSPIKLSEGGTVGHYFETNGVLRKYEVYCPSYSNSIGSMTISIYVWLGDYASTVASQPIATAQHTDFADNAILSVPVYKYVNANKYLVVFTDPVETVGVWKCSKSVEGITNKLYINGVFSEDTGLDTVITVNENVFVSDISRTNRNAFTYIDAEDYDKKTEGITKGNGIIDVAEWRTVLSYADINFGSTSPKGFEAKIYNYGCSDHGEMQVWIDNPLNGTKIAEIYYEYRFQDRAWETLYDTISEKVTGVHDVYIIFSIAGITVDRFRFLSSAPSDSFNVTRLEEFSPAHDDSFDLGSDTWSGTDMMGRKLPGYETVGPRDVEREVHLFYHSWHAWQQTNDKQNMNNNQATIKNYLRKNPGGTEADIKNEYYYPDGSVIWGSGMKFWNESIYGYYSTLDEWVVRKQMELFSAAGIDTITYDNTNGTTTWAGGYMTIGKVMHQMHLEGIQTPNMVFMTRFGPGWESNESMRKIYQYMYSTGLYSDCWHYYEGKPLIRAYPSYLLTEDTLHEDINALNREIHDFFTFRPPQASYFVGQTQENQWPWLEVYPQHGFVPLTDSKYNYEIVAVGVAQNANESYGLTGMNGEGVFGRSYTYKDKFSLYSDDSKYYGYNFQEQWDRAMELNPKSVFVTGWNELTMGHEKDAYDIEGWCFGDNYNDEYSRDIEPTKGDFKDNYYYQMVANIRRFKGVNPTPVAGDETTIRIGGAFSQWDTITPEFHGYTGGTDNRYAMIKGNNGYYENSTGRNDIVLSKVARDSNYLYFYVKTAENLSKYTDPSWMRLFINTDRTYKTGWEGYDFAVNIDSPASSTSTTLSYSADGWNWKPVGTLTYKYSGNQMMIRIPRDMLGLTDKIIDIEFKWNDNMQNQGDIMDVYVSGDTAPIGRFAYRYTETTEYDKTPVDEPVTVSDLKLNLHKHSVIMSIGNTTAFASGKQKTLDVAPEIINEKTMIPLRFFSEGFGAEVKWNDATKTATVSLDGNTVNITVGKTTMDANGTEVTLESPAVIVNSRTLVPMRDIAEALGKKVLWVDGGLIIAGENPETVHSYEWVQDMTEDNFGIR